MERKTTTTGEFEEAIKNFSKVSLEVDTLINTGNADAHKLKNKSIESRNEAIAYEASKRLKSFEAEQKGVKESKESLKTPGTGTLEQLFLEEVKLEFDKGVEEHKNLLRGNSAINVNTEVENKKSENAEDEEGDAKNDSSDSDEDTDDENTDSETTTEKDSSEEEDESSSDGDEESEDENTEDDETNEPEKVVADDGVEDSSKK